MGYINRHLSYSLLGLAIDPTRPEALAAVRMLRQQTPGPAP
jgi:hypothetical protein